MWISTKGRYAVRLMLELALRKDEGYISVKSISAKQEISEKYLEQIIGILSRAGFVKSVRGAQGGYQLAKAPAAYTVGSILRLIEGNLSSVACLADVTNTCKRRDICATVEVWKAVNDAVNGVVDTVTLQDLVDRTLAKRPQEVTV